MPRWLPILSRLAIAAFGGYALSTLVAIFLAGTLPLSRGDGVITGMLAAFPIYAATVMWVFAAKSLRQAYLGVLSAMALSGFAAWAAT